MKSRLLLFLTLLASFGSYGQTVNQAKLQNAKPVGGTILRSIASGDTSLFINQGAPGIVEIPKLDAVSKLNKENIPADADANSYFDDGQAGSFNAKAYLQDSVLTGLVNHWTGERESYKLVTVKPDGSPINDTDVIPGRGIYRKKSGKGYYQKITQNNRIDLGIYGNMSDFAAAFQQIWQSGFIAVSQSHRTVYNIKSEITITDKDIIAYLNGATLKVTLPNQKYALNHIVTNSTKYNVNSITYGGTSDKYTNVIVSGNTGYKDGDLLKIFSKDLVSGFSNILMGEFLVPEKVTYDGTNTTLKIKGQFNYAYATTIRIAKIKKYRVDINNVVVDGTIAANQVCGFAKLQGSTDSYFSQVTISGLTFPAINLQGTYNTTVNGCSMYYGADAIDGLGPNGSIGYGINDGWSCNTKVVNCNFNSLRHATTTNTAALVTTAQEDYTYYGETNGMVVANCTATNVLRAFDTHPPGYNINFIGNTIDKSEAGYSLRSRDTHIDGGEVRSSNYGVVISAEGDNINQRITIKNLKVLNPLEFSIYASTGRTIKPKIEVSNCSLEGAIFMRDAEYYLSGNTINIEASGNASWLNNWNSIGQGLNNIITQKTTVVNGVVFSGTGSYISDGEKFILPSGQTIIYLARNGTNGSNNVYVTRSPVLFIGASPTSNTTAEMDNSTIPVLGRSTFLSLKVSWRTETLNGVVSTNKASNFISLRQKTSNAALVIENKDICDDVIYMSIDAISAIKDLSEYPINAGTHQGQKLVLYNNSAFNVILPMLNRSSVYALLPKQSVELVFNGSTWLYLNNQSLNLPANFTYSVASPGTTTVSIPHSLGVIPSAYSVYPENANSAGISWYEATATAIVVRYTTAPTGPLNYRISVTR